MTDSPHNGRPRPAFRVTSTGATTWSTRRLRFRRFTPADADALAALLGDPVAMRYVGDGAAVEAAGVQRWLRAAQQASAPNAVGLWALDDLVTGAFVGYCGVADGEDTGDPELMYALRSEWWGRGLATEAATAVMELADRHLDIVWATADPANTASLRILGHLGFQVTHEAPDVHGLPTLFLERRRLRR